MIQLNSTHIHQYSFNRIVFYLTLTGVLLLIHPMNNCAQVFKGGLKAGISSTQIDGDGYSGFNESGAILGASVKTQLNESWDAILEMQWIQKGSRDPADPANGKIQSYRIELDYIEVPVLLSYNTNKFSIQSGLSFGYLFSSKESDHNGTINDPFFAFKSSETSYNIGLQYSFTERFAFNMRYQRSLLPIADDVRFNQTTFGFFGGSYSTVLQFTAFYSLHQPE